MRTSKSATTEVLPVPRSKEEARRLYDRISGVYDLLAGPFERKAAEMGLERLSLGAGERVLEIGFGSGYCLHQIAMSVGPTGRVYGIDLSLGMIEVTRRRLRRTSMIRRTELCCGDGQVLPFRSDVFDAVFISFALELFDTPDIPRVLAETRRVLTRGGRLGAVSMSREGERGILLRLYEWAHTKWPAYIDCRPIYLERFLEDAGFGIHSKQMVSMLGLPGEIIVASSGSSAA
ncbi:MAG: class I SAM-dependent methyltransferase [Thermoplasmata archaeon]